MSPKFLAYLVVSYFQRRFLKQNTVARLNQSIWPHKNFGLSALQACFEKYFQHEVQVNINGNLQ